VAKGNTAATKVIKMVLCAEIDRQKSFGQLGIDAFLPWLAWIDPGEKTSRAPWAAENV
jgi:hypothetical protein